MHAAFCSLAVCKPFEIAHFVRESFTFRGASAGVSVMDLVPELRGLYETLRQCRRHGAGLGRIHDKHLEYQDDNS